MERTEVLARVQETFRELLNNEEMVLDEGMGPDDIDEWTSLSQVQILAELEHSFGIRFSLFELMSLKSIGSIVDAILRHIS